MIVLADLGHTRGAWRVLAAYRGVSVAGLQPADGGGAIPAGVRRILGIDPGTVVTGYGIIDARGKRVAPVAFGAIRPGRRGEMPARLAMIHRQVEDLITHYSPDVLVVEEAFYGDNPKTAIKLGQARGVILVLGALNDLEIAEYSPRLIKQAVVGKGNATKEQVQYMVRRILGLPDLPDPPDAADALAVALCYALRPRVVASRTGHLTKAQKQLRELGVM